jgi:AraC-like DNA-binding protein
MTEFEQEVALIREMGLKESPLRQEYEQRVAALHQLGNRLLASGKTEEQTARILHAERRELGRQYKQASPPLFREYIYAATAAKYGDPLGSTYEQLRRTKTCVQIISSASRPIENLDNRLTLDGFEQWYREHHK